MRRTIRLRLTILYACLFLASGAGLLAITYALFVHSSDGVLVGTRADGSSFTIGDKQGSGSDPDATPTPAAAAGVDADGAPLTQQQLQDRLRRDRALAQRQHDAELHRLLEQSGIALALMAAVSIGLGWFAAGRVLRPLRTLNDRVRAISATNLHRRLALTGPEDELTQLAGTFDDLLDRLEAAFTAQRQFVANASHELRTPLARAQTLAEVSLADPDASVDSLRASHRRVLAAGHQQERLIEALLTLARSERGLDEREPIDLAAIAELVVRGCRADARRRGVELVATLRPAATAGDPRLVERLVINLVDNARHYNRPGGHVEVTTLVRDGRAVLAVANSGPVVPAEELERLMRPFQRLGVSRTDDGEGSGLGLSIVAAIATAHDATLGARARPGGGLDIEIAFPFTGDAHPAHPVSGRPRRPRVSRRQKGGFL